MKLNAKQYVDQMINKLQTSMKNIFYSKKEVKDLIDNVDLDTSEIDAKIESLNNRSIIGKELSYGYFTLNPQTVAQNDSYSFTAKNVNGINYSETEKTIELKANITYQIFANMYGASKLNAAHYIFANINDNSYIGNPGSMISSKWESFMNDEAINFIYTPKEDINIKLIEMASYSPQIEQGNIIIKEISRQIIIDPAEKAKNIEFDIGEFYIETQSENLTVGSHIEFQKVYGNLKCSTGAGQENGIVTLKANKKYRVFVRFSIDGGSTQSHLYTDIFNKTKDEKERDVSGLTGGFTTYSYPGVNETIIETGDTDEEIEVRISYITNPRYIRYATMVVQEIAHPYYFNYYKDSLTSKTLFEGDANSVGTYNLTDNLDNYEWLEINYSIFDSTYTYENTIILNKSNFNKRNLISLVNSTAKCGIDIVYTFSETKLEILGLYNTAWKIPKITKVFGYGFNYENPYKDLLSESSFAYTEEDIEKIYNSLGGE